MASYSVYISIFVCLFLPSCRSSYQTSSWPTTTEDDYYDRLLPDDELPKIMSKGMIVKVLKGDRVIIPCEVIRLGKYSVVWKKTSDFLWVLQLQSNQYQVQSVTSDPRISNLNTSLVISDVDSHDEGIYSCEVSGSNIENEIIHYQLVVIVPPSAWVPYSENYIELREGKTAQLSCRVSGNPRPNVTWEKEGGEISGKAHDTTLTIPKVRAEDAGIYACIASNGAAQPAKAMFTLSVHYSPRVRATSKVVQTGIGFDATLTCIILASSTFKVTWHKGKAPINPMRLRKMIPGKNKYSLYFENVIHNDFGMYSCNASNFWGNGSALIELSGRASMPIVTSHPRGADQTKYPLTWDVTSFAPVTSYDVLYRKLASSDGYDDSPTYLNVTVPGVTSNSMYRSQRYLIRDLTPDTKYLVKIRASNGFGDSKWSHGFVFSTKKVEDRPILHKPLTNKTEVNLIETPTRLKLHSIEGNSIEKHPLKMNRPKIIQPEEAYEEAISMAVEERITQNEGLISSNEDTQNLSSSATPSHIRVLTESEKRAQMAAIITAISLSGFFY